MKYPDSAREIAAAIGDDSMETFAGEIGCGMTSLRRWLAGTHLPRSASHRRNLEARGVPSHALRATGERRAATAPEAA